MIEVEVGTGNVIENERGTDQDEEATRALEEAGLEAHRDEFEGVDLGVLQEGEVTETAEVCNPLSFLFLFTYC